MIQREFINEIVNGTLSDYNDIIAIAKEQADIQELLAGLWAKVGQLGIECQKVVLCETDKGAFVRTEGNTQETKRERVMKAMDYIESYFGISLFDDVPEGTETKLPKGKRGRPKVKELKDYIRVSDKESFIKELKELLKDRKGKELAAYIKAFCDCGLMEFVPYKALKEIEGVGNEKAYSSCKTGRGYLNKEDCESAKSYIERAFANYISEIGTGGK